MQLQPEGRHSLAQGRKPCRTPDDDRLAQLSELTKFSLQAYRKNQWL